MFASNPPGARFGSGASSDDPKTVIASGTGFVAVGSTGTTTKTTTCSGNAAAWSSPDGTTWRLDSAGGLDDTGCTTLTTATAGPDTTSTVLAGGSATPPSADASTSPFIASDAGGSWSGTTTPPVGGSSVDSLLRTPNGYAAFGTSGAGGAVTWTSSDGSAWSAPREVPGDHGFKVEGAASQGNNLVVIASYDVHNDTDPPSSASWHSSDGGLTWSYSRVKGRVAYGITATSHGFAMAGVEGTSYTATHPGVWLSSDGSSWRPVTSGLGSRGTVSAIAGEGDDLLAVGVIPGGGAHRALSQPLAWSSADGGQTWTSAPPPPVLPPLDSVQYGAYITRLVINGDRVVALGEGDADGTDDAPRITYSASWLAS